MDSSTSRLSASQRPTFVDSATDCAICLNHLSEEETITLRCGHIWHLRCIKEQLYHAEPNPSRRLLFSGCRCGKCSAFCDHPALSDATRATSRLRAAVDALIAEQVAVDGLDRHPEVLSPSGAFRGDPIGLGWSLYAFFLCSICREPYFGGTVACAEGGDIGDEVLPPADRLCPRCVPGTSAVCMHAAHTAFHVYKCRYCCRSATFVCHGTTHLCTACHEHHGGYRPGHERATVACPGPPACTAPLPRGAARHANGPSHACEQVLHCTLCASDPGGVGARAAAAAAERRSANMVFNPDAARGLRGWTRAGYAMWRTEASEVRVRAGARNFVSTYHWCSMAQMVPLGALLARPGAACVEVSARYMARTDCPSVFVIEAALYSAQFAQLAHFVSGPLPAPPDFWDPVRHVFPPTPAAAYLAVCVRGKDDRFWAGNFGSKVTDIAARVLFDRSAAPEDEIIRPGALDSVPEPVLSVGAYRALMRFSRRS